MNWIWLAVRVFGLSSYFLLTLSLLVGMNSHLLRKKNSAIVFHQIIGQVALLFIGIHACLLLYDSYEPFSLKSLLIPFAALEEPILSGFGTIATYLLILVIFTSDYMKKVGYSLWKKTHYLVFPIWLLSAIHGLFMGTDSQTKWAEFLYEITTLLVILSTVVLLFNKRKRMIKTVNE